MYYMASELFVYVSKRSDLHVEGEMLYVENPEQYSEQRGSV